MTQPPLPELVPLRRFMLDRGIEFDRQMNNVVGEWFQLWYACDEWDIFVKDVSDADQWCDNIWVRLKSDQYDFEHGLEVCNSFAYDEIDISKIDGSIWLWIWWD